MRAIGLNTFHHLVYASMITGVLAGCGNGSDTVTNSQVISEDRQTQSVVPHANILLATLPEMRTSVFFEAHSFELTTEGQLLIDPIAVRLRKYPDSHVLIIGYGDDDLSDDDSLAISYERALSVAIYIASVFSIEEERIQLVAAGHTESAKSNDPNGTSQQSRRVDVLSPKAVVRTRNPYHHYND